VSSAIPRWISVALLGALGAWSPARGETINCIHITNALMPYTISTPGVYCVTEKITTNLASGAAITINANNVVLDLNSFAIGNLGAGASTSALGIYAVDRQNIVIRDGTLRGFWIAVALVDGVTAGGTTSNSSGHAVNAVVSDQSYGAGIVVQGPGTVVTGSRVVNTQGSTATNALLAALSGDGATGIFVSGSGARVTNSAVLNTDCSNGCTASAAKVRGIQVSGAPGAVIAQNFVANAAMTAVTDARALDVKISSADVFVDSNVFTTWPLGISFDSTSTGVYLNNGLLNVTTPASGGVAVGTTNY